MGGFHPLVGGKICDASLLLITSSADGVALLFSLRPDVRTDLLLTFTDPTVVKTDRIITP